MSLSFPLPEINARHGTGPLAMHALRSFFYSLDRREPPTRRVVG